MSSTASSKTNTSSSTYRVNYSDYVANITSSPKTTRKLPTTSSGNQLHSTNNVNSNRLNLNLNMPQYGGSSEKCVRCLKTVYMAERKLGAGRPFHSSCFNCHQCRRKLESATVSEHKGEIYCKTCYTREFGAHGLISGVTMSTERTANQTRPSRRSSVGNDLDAPVSNYQQTRPRASSTENLLVDKYSASPRIISDERPSKTIGIISGFQSSGDERKSNGNITIVDTTFRRPVSPIKWEPTTYEHRFKPIENQVEDQHRRSSQNDPLSSNRGTSAFVEIPVLIESRRDNSTVGRVQIPSAPARNEHTNRSRSPSPSAISNEPYRRQSSYDQDKAMSDSYSRLVIHDPNSDLNRRSPASPSGVIDMATSDPLISSTYHRSSSSSYEMKYRSSVSSTNDHARNNPQSRDQSPSRPTIDYRSPSPTGSQTSSNNMRISTNSSRDGFPETTGSTIAPPVIPIRYEFQRDSVSSNGSSTNYRPSSPQRSSSTLNDFITQTNLVGDSSTSSTGKFPALSALARSRIQRDESDDEFNS